MFLFWQHLALAGLIEGSYSGSAGGAGTTDHVIGTNSPESKLKGSGFGVIYAGIKSSNSYYYDGNYGHVFVFGAYKSNDLPVSSVITGSEAYNMDTKFDNGLPASGKILSWKQGAATYVPNCTTASNSSSVYQASTTSNVCSLIFVTGF